MAFFKKTNMEMENVCMEIEWVGWEQTKSTRFWCGWILFFCCCCKILVDAVPNIIMLDGWTWPKNNQRKKGVIYVYWPMKERIEKVKYKLLLLW